MTPGEIINLAGIVLVAVVTTIGWVATYLGQHEIVEKQSEAQRGLAKLQEQFVREREARQFFIPEKLGHLAEIAAWFDQGNRLLFNIKGMSNWPKDVPEPLSNRYVVMWDSFLQEYRDWRVSSSKHLTRANLYDPIEVEPFDPRTFDTAAQTLPKNLGGLVGFFFLQANERLTVAFIPDHKPRLSLSDILSREIHEAALIALQRVREHIVKQAYEEASQ